MNFDFKIFDFNKFSKNRFFICFYFVLLSFGLFLYLEPFQHLVSHLFPLLGFNYDFSTVQARCVKYGIKIFLFVLFIPFPFLFLNKTDDDYLFSKSNSRENLFIKIYLLLTAVFIVTVSSTDSPIYPINPWVDPHCFFTVGKSMWYGKVPYRDLLEQKGPLLYFIHALAYPISHTTLLGIYFFEIASTFMLCFYFYKTARLFTGSSCLFAVAPVVALIYSAYCFRFGDSAEEFCLPLLAYPIYISVKALKENTTLSIKQLIAAGICAGTIFWIKFSMNGFFIAWIIIPVFNYIKEKKYMEILKSAVFIITGLFITTVPSLIYFGLNGAIKDLLQVYIVDNIFSYSVSNSIFAKFYFVAFYMFKTYRRNMPLLFLMVMSFISLIRFSKNRKITIHILLCYFVTSFAIYQGGQEHPYYSLILNSFASFAILPFNALLNRITFTKIKAMIAAVLSIVISTSYALFITPNNRLLKLKQEDLPQFKIDQIIKKSKDKSVLNYGFLDLGIYTYSDIVPQCKSFVLLTIPKPEGKNLQDDFVKNRRAEFVVATKDYPIVLENYDFVIETKCTEYDDEIIRLYRRKTN